MHLLVMIVSLAFGAPNTIELEIEGLTSWPDQVSSSTIFVGESHIYVDATSHLHIFNRDGSLHTSINVEEDTGGKWIANYALLEQRGWLCIATMSIVNGAYDFRFLVYDEKGTHLGDLTDTNLLEPKQVFFRQMWELPDGSVLVNYWDMRSEQQNRAIELRKIDLEEDGDGDFRVTYDGQPLYRRLFEEGSRISNDKSLTLASIRRNGQTEILFTHVAERRLHKVKLGDRYRTQTYKRSPQVSLDLGKSFKDLAMDIKTNNQIEPSVVEAIIPTEDKLLVFHRENAKSKLEAHVKQDVGFVALELNGVDHGVLVGHKNTELFFYVPDNHAIVTATVDP